MLRREDTLQNRQAEEEVREAGVASPRDGDAREQPAVLPQRVPAGC